MELRSSHRKNENEYKELQVTLNGMGFYEDGMELEEMRQIIDALQQSVSEEESHFLDMDMERAIRESEMDFMPLNNGRVFNSTMTVGTSPCNSPEIPSQTIVVHAEVHHELDWSPLYTEEQRLRRKRLATTPPKTGDLNHVQDCQFNGNEIIEPNAKRFEQYMNGITTEQPFSDIYSNVVAINASHDALFSSGQPINDNDISNHDVIGPISMRPPPNDSGVNSGSEKAQTSPSTSTSSLSPPSSSPQSPSPSTSSRNVVAQSVTSTSERSTNSVIEIFGPVSMRRPINDSGVNSFNGTANISSSSWDFHMSSHSLVDNNNNNVRASHSMMASAEYSPHGVVHVGNTSSTPGRFICSASQCETSPHGPLCAQRYDDTDDYEQSEPSL